MSDTDWQVECQCRYVARTMKAGRTRQDRLAIFETWKKKLPGIDKARVAEIWQKGIPMPPPRAR